MGQHGDSPYYTVKLIWVLFDSIFALKKSRVSHTHHITFLKQHLTEIIANFTVYLAISSNSIWNPSAMNLPTHTQNHYELTQQNGTQWTFALSTEVKLGKTHYVYLKWNLYNRHGPTNANGTVCNLNITLHIR